MDRLRFAVACFAGAEAEAHATRVVRVVVVVRVATGADNVEVIRIVAIRTAPPPVADGTCAVCKVLDARCVICEDRILRAFLHVRVHGCVTAHFDVGSLPHLVLLAGYGVASVADGARFVHRDDGVQKSDRQLLQEFAVCPFCHSGALVASGVSALAVCLDGYGVAFRYRYGNYGALAHFEEVVPVVGMVRAVDDSRLAVSVVAVVRGYVEAVVSCCVKLDSSEIREGLALVDEECPGVLGCAPAGLNGAVCAHNVDASVLQHFADLVERVACVHVGIRLVPCVLADLVAVGADVEAFAIKRPGGLGSVGVVYFDGCKVRLAEGFDLYEACSHFVGCCHVGAVQLRHGGGCGVVRVVCVVVDDSFVGADLVVEAVLVVRVHVAGLRQAVFHHVGDARLAGLRAVQEVVVEVCDLLCQRLAVIQGVLLGVSGADGYRCQRRQVGDDVFLGVAVVDDGAAFCFASLDGDSAPEALAVCQLVECLTGCRHFDRFPDCEEFYNLRQTVSVDGRAVVRHLLLVVVDVSVCILPAYEEVAVPGRKFAGVRVRGAVGDAFDGFEHCLVVLVLSEFDIVLLQCLRIKRREGCVGCDFAVVEVVASEGVDVLHGVRSLRCYRCGCRFAVVDLFGL